MSPDIRDNNSVFSSAVSDCLAIVHLFILMVFVLVMLDKLSHTPFNHKMKRRTRRPHNNTFARRAAMIVSRSLRELESTTHHTEEKETTEQNLGVIAINAIYYSKRWVGCRFRKPPLKRSTITICPTSSPSFIRNDRSWWKCGRLRNFIAEIRGIRENSPHSCRVNIPIIKSWMQHRIHFCSLHANISVDRGLVKAFVNRAVNNPIGSNPTGTLISAITEFESLSSKSGESLDDDDDGEKLDDIRAYLRAVDHPVPTFIQRVYSNLFKTGRDESEVNIKYLDTSCNIQCLFHLMLNSF